MKTLVIIPAHNEEESILKTINSLKREIEKSEYLIDYIVINDGSKDNTENVLIDNKINHLTHIVNKGVGAGIKSGMLYALENDYTYVTQFDADGQHIAEFIPGLIENMQLGYDVSIGSRFLGDKKPWSLRMLGSKILSNLIWIKVGFKQKITDPTSGQRMMNQSIMHQYILDAAASEPAFAVKYIKKGYKVGEIKVDMNEREEGESHFNITNSIFFMLEQTMAIVFGY